MIGELETCVLDWGANAGYRGTRLGCRVHALAYGGFRSPWWILFACGRAAEGHQPFSYLVSLFSLAPVPSQNNPSEDIPAVFVLRTRPRAGAARLGSGLLVSMLNAGLIEQLRVYRAQPIVLSLLRLKDVEPSSSFLRQSRSASNVWRTQPSKLFVLNT